MTLVSLDEYRSAVDSNGCVCIAVLFTQFMITAVSTLWAQIFYKVV